MKAGTTSKSNVCFHLFKGSQEAGVSRKAKRGWFSEQNTTGFISCSSSHSSSPNSCANALQPSPPTSTECQWPGCLFARRTITRKAEYTAKSFLQQEGMGGWGETRDWSLSVPSPDRGSLGGVKCAGVLHGACTDGKSHISVQTGKTCCSVPKTFSTTALPGTPQTTDGSGCLPDRDVPR